jgi:hypothetical protein
VSTPEPLTGVDGLIVMAPIAAFLPPEHQEAAQSLVSPSKVQTIQQAAQQAYDREDQAWFDSLPAIDLGVLWGLACTESVSYDDEVFDALAKRGWFD